MTLVEVVAGLALLGTLLAAVLVVRARYARQSAAAERRLQAVAAADALLAAWHTDPRLLPRYGSGRVDGDAQLAWRTALVPNREVNDLGAQVVHLEILDDRPAAASAVLTSVEFVVGEQASRPATQPADAGTTGGTADSGPRPTNPRRSGGGTTRKPPATPNAKGQTNAAPAPSLHRP